MANMTIPATWTKYDLGTDFVTYKRDGHTSDVPLLVKFKRRPLSGGTSTYQVLGVMGLGDVVSGETRNTLVTLDIRNVAGQPATRIAAYLGELATLIGTAGFKDDATVELDLPY
jgi:hypothetical protein